MTKLHLTFVIASVITLESCKAGSPQKYGSETLSLDNFAAGTTIRENSCKGTKKVLLGEDRIRFDPKLSLSSEDRTAMRGAVIDYLSAVPENMQKVFADWGGEILITPDANAICTKLFSDRKTDQYVNKGRESLESCYIFAEDAANSRAVFTIVHKPDLNAIKHGGVRMFGYMFSQFFPRLVKNDDAGSKAKFKLAREPSSMMSSFKLKMAESFLSDMVGAKRYNLKNLDTFLGAGGGSVVKKNLEAGLSVFSNVSFVFAGERTITQGAKQLRQARFEDFIFAEAFDSFRCSSSSLATMKEEFPATYLEFSKADRTLDDIGIASATASLATEEIGNSEEDAEAASFALQAGTMIPVGLQGSSVQFYPVSEAGGLDTSASITPTGPAARNKMESIAMFAQMAPQFLGLVQALGAAGAAGAASSQGSKCAGGGCVGGSCGSCGG